MKLKVFDVVKLNDGKKATIIETNKDCYKAEIVDECGVSHGYKSIKDKEIAEVIFAR